jgi:hypothetical protein
MYDVYYTTGGGPWVNAGTDTWVNLWLELIAPKLEVKPVLLLHRNKPKGYDDFQFPIEAHWHGDDILKFEKIIKDCRRIHILHGHYTPMKVLEENKHKIYSNILHNSVDHILKSQVGTDGSLALVPFMDSQWEVQINDWAKESIWIGLFDILIQNRKIPNFYEFKYNLPLSNDTKIGFAARCDSRKNPHYLDGLDFYAFTNSRDFKLLWIRGTKLDKSNGRVFHYDSKFKDRFYSLDWGISHSAFTAEPFGYSIFEAVDKGKLPILNGSWCKELEYPYRASSKKEFVNIYNKLIETPYEEKNKWFLNLKQYMKDNFTDKERWVREFLDIYNS